MSPPPPPPTHTHTHTTHTHHTHHTPPPPPPRTHTHTLYRRYASVDYVCIGSGNGLSPSRRQAITWTNAGLMSIEIRIGIGILSLSLKNTFETTVCLNGGHFVRPEYNGRHFPDNSKYIFVLGKILNKISLKFVIEVPTDIKSKFCSGIGLAPNRRQAINWNNVDHDPWRHMASLNHNELKEPRHSWVSNHSG